MVLTGVPCVIEPEAECMMGPEKAIEGWPLEGGDFVLSLGDGPLLLINGGGGGIACLGCPLPWGSIPGGIPG